MKNQLLNKSSSEKTIDSQTLLVMVNEARNLYGEPEVRNNKFIEKIEDELEGEHYTKSVVQKMNNTQMTVIDMSIKQALRVAARESKAVRRALVDKLEDMQKLPVQSKNGLTEYRQARALKMTMEVVSSIFELMPNLAAESRQCVMAGMVNRVVGYDALPLPVIEEHYYSATEIGEMFGCSANRIGRLSTKHQLKTEQYGKFFMDKSRHSSKQVETFRYNAEGVEALRQLLMSEEACHH